jgi:GntR family transcriptional regulator
MSPRRLSEASEGAAGSPVLERDSTTPLYEQIAARLKHEINSGRFSANGRLPSESELTQRFGVSRVTARQATAMLLQEGYVQRKQGKGTFVAGQKLKHELHSMRGFYDSLLAQGVEPVTRLLEFVGVCAPELVASGLAGPGGACYFLRRLYVVDGTPIAMVCAHLPPETAKVSWQQASEYPIYAILERLLAVRVVSTTVRIRAQPAGAKVGRELGLGPRAPILIMERQSLCEQNKVKEQTCFYIRPENYEFLLTAQGPLPISSSIRGAGRGTGRHTGKNADKARRDREPA